MEDFLWDIIPWGYQILLVIEAMQHDILDIFFSIITDFGSALGYIVILSVVYWCVDKKIGQGLAFAYLYSSVINTWIKLYYSIPRPYESAIEPHLDAAGITDRLTPIRFEDTPSFPSGHTQGAVTVWGYLFYHFRQTWFRVLALVLIILIAFSRMYLGVHFPQDIIGSLLFGIVYLSLWITAEPKIRIWLSERTIAWRYALAVMVPLFVWLLQPVEETAQAMGAAIGLGVGYILEGQTVRFSSAGVFWKRLLRALVGLLLIITIYFGMASFSDRIPDTGFPFVSALLRLVRYALLGFMGGWAAPWFFIKVGLVQKEQSKQSI